MLHQRVTGLFPTDVGRPPGPIQDGTAAPAGRRNGGERNSPEALMKAQIETCPETGLLTTAFRSIWSDDRRYLQGWEAVR